MKPNKTLKLQLGTGIKLTTYTNMRELNFLNEIFFKCKKKVLFSIKVLQNNLN